jgi:hypothetical protein
MMMVLNYRRNQDAAAITLAIRGIDRVEHLHGACARPITPPARWTAVARLPLEGAGRVASAPEGDTAPARARLQAPLHQDRRADQVELREAFLTEPIDKGELS